jgi:two-component system sensor histidine kinase CreC
VSLRARIFLAFSLAAAAGVAYVAWWVRQEVRPQYLKSMEESLADVSTLLAAELERDLRGGSGLEVSRLRVAMAAAGRRELSARIYDLVKTRMDLRVYVVDQRGKVVYDSDGGRDEGRDYSQWNDVYLALRGGYGARATWRDERDPSSNVLYVAAPVRSEAGIVGAVTVSKALTGVNQFISGAERRILLGAVLAAALFAALSWIISGWVTGPVRRLTAYALAVRDGARSGPPPAGRGEIAEMGRAFEEMRQALEGRRYVERYVETLTHEIKAPLSAIRGAAELLAEDPPAERRRRFAGNVRAETERIAQLVDRLLELSALESRRELRDVAELDAAELARSCAAALAPAAEARGVKLRVEAPEPAGLRGERFLVERALANLVQNALEFAPKGSEVLIRAAPAGGGAVCLEVLDAGPGVPDYALERVFERFYSLPRPETGRKSSGLGLAFAREAADLHGGKAGIENRPEGGARAWLELPTGMEND